MNFCENLPTWVYLYFRLKYQQYQVTLHVNPRSPAFQIPRELCPPALAPCGVGGGAVSTLGIAGALGSHLTDVLQLSSF